MRRITTAHILADKALDEPCGQRCVDWAISMLLEGRDGEYLTRLAGMLPPYNHFEVAALRDNALREQAIVALDPRVAVLTHATEQLRMALSDDVELVEAVALAHDLCISLDYAKELFDFYLLFNAYQDLLTAEVQWYWNGATSENIVAIIRERAAQFVGHNP
ncbi:MAG TPA: hypothetical protein VHD36_18195 [Pirellulales bacterium]|nr:hypothetical protein [Pirellulales bacterium]